MSRCVCLLTMLSTHDAGFLHHVGAIHDAGGIHDAVVSTMLGGAHVVGLHMMLRCSLHC